MATALKRGRPCDKSVGQSAKRLRKLRLSRGMTLKEVQEATGGAVSSSTLSNYELGRTTRLNHAALVALCGAYGVDIETLLKGG